MLALATLFLGVVLNVAPYLGYWSVNGHSTQIGKRLPYEADNNSLKLFRLAIPLRSYGIAPLATFLAKPETTTENKQYLGMVAVLGLLGALSLVGYWPYLKKSERELLVVLSLLLAACLVVSVQSGLGTLVAYTISPQIRAYGRIVPLVGFFGLCLFYFCSQFIHQRLVSPWSKVWGGIIALITFISLIDQVSWFSPQSTIPSAFNEDATYFSALEHALPQKAAVLQLPYKAFPESPVIVRLIDYDQLRGFFHSQTLRWSAAALKGSSGAIQIEQVSLLPGNQLVPAAESLGYKAILVDRWGYPDEGEHQLADLASRSGVIRLALTHPRYAAFELSPMTELDKPGRMQP